MNRSSVRSSTNRPNRRGGTTEFSGPSLMPWWPSPQGCGSSPGSSSSSSCWSPAMTSSCAISSRSRSSGHCRCACSDSSSSSCSPFPISRPSDHTSPWISSTANSAREETRRRHHHEHRHPALQHRRRTHCGRSFGELPRRRAADLRKLQSSRVDRLRGRRRRPARARACRHPHTLADPHLGTCCRRRG